jgi:hypothetical protein
MQHIQNLMKTNIYSFVVGCMKAQSGVKVAVGTIHSRKQTLNLLLLEL